MVPTFWFCTESGNVRPVMASALAEPLGPRSTNPRETAQVGRPVRVCVIGAGSSGLVTIKALREAGHEVQAFDLASRVGGLWIKDSDSGKSAAYDSLRINTSRQQMQFRDFPMPERYGDYATHAQVAEYFRAYADHFDLSRSVHFRTRVEKVTPEGQGYLVEATSLDSGASFRGSFDAVVVAHGHHHTPAFPDPMPEGHFDGIVLHAHSYRNPDRPAPLRGRRVVVVGFGNSAVDIAVELSSTEDAGSVVLSTRRGAWVLPRYLFGRPIDQGRLLPLWLPGAWRRRISTWAFRHLRGTMTDYGLPEPDHLIGEAHPTLSDELPDLVKKGVIEVKPAIERLAGDTVHFRGGAQTKADAIVYCTGYRVSFPFFDDAHLAAPENELPLFRRVFHPTHRRLFFVGLAQPLGAIMPIAELQARWVSAHLAGRYNLPDPQALALDVDRERSELSSRYVRSRRHTMQIDPEKYTRSLESEWRRGRRRALRRVGQPFPTVMGPGAP